MASSSFLDSLCNGSGGRLALGTAVLVYLNVYNEASAPCVLFGTLVATIYGCIAARCKSSLRVLQMPYVRASNKFDFSCLFLATWMDTLATLCACGALARTLSLCLDAMTGGLARIFILGRNAPTNEPWPDVVGVAVVFIVTGMFMLGLEHSKAFSLVMSMGLFGLNAVLSGVSWRNGDLLAWTHNFLQPNGLSSLLTAAATLTYAFPAEYSVTCSGFQRFTGLILNSMVSASLLLASGCLSTIVHYKPMTEYMAVPLFTILDVNSFHSLVPAAACLLMLTCTGAFLELFQELYGIIVRFATSEWRIFSKQISYESADSGNPVLAVFIAGSLCVTVAFACPMQHLCYTLAASHLFAGLFRAFYLLYTPYRPKFMQHSGSESSLSYSRLSTAPIVKSNASASCSRPKRSLWNIGLPKSNKQTSKKKPKVKPKNKQEVEKEWLLLGEPTSPCPQRETSDGVASTVLSDAEPAPADFEYPDKCDTDTDTSTDIDAIVDEYRQKIKVTTAGPIERTVRIPTLASWRVTIFAIIVCGLGIALTIAGILTQWPPATLTGSIGVLIISVMMTFIPSYTGSAVNVSPILCCMSILGGIVLFVGCAEYSWAAIVFWTVAGLILLLRCDNWCCNCFNDINNREKHLLRRRSSGFLVRPTTATTTKKINKTKTTTTTTTTIRMPRTPKGIVTIPMRVNGSNR